MSNSNFPDINIFGFNTTTCDAPWPAWIFFTKECNLKCPYCHNKVDMYNQPVIASNAVENKLIEINNNPLIKGIIISGGEPTIQNSLIDFLRRIKTSFPRLKVKLDTNGTRPMVISNIIRENLIHFIAMDIKMPFERYEELRKDKRESFCQELGNLAFITSQLIKRSKIEHEFRITVDPNLISDKDLKQIIKNFKDIKIQKIIER